MTQKIGVFLGSMIGEVLEVDGGNVGEVECWRSRMLEKQEENLCGLG